jgi:LAO/AO transport system kinase
MPVERLAEGVLEADPEAIAEALASVEDTRPDTLPRQIELLGRLEQQAPREHGIVGLTGPPGAGKSTLAGALIRYWLDRDAGVGMVAVDPSSRHSGGALLGDRARLRFSSGERVFVRSMAARDQLGGLAPATRAAAAVLRAAYRWTLVETVGVGQSEIDIATLADSVVLVLQPGSGDTLQFMKAGILEIPDVLVVHKWDLGAVAERTRTDLESMLALQTGGAAWRPPVLGVSGETGAGVAELAEAVAAHRAHLERDDALSARRARGRVAWAMERFTQRYGALGLERVGAAARRPSGRSPRRGAPLSRPSALSPLEQDSKPSLVEIEQSQDRVVVGERGGRNAERLHALLCQRQAVAHDRLHPEDLGAFLAQRLDRVRGASAGRHQVLDHDRALAGEWRPLDALLLAVPLGAAPHVDHGQPHALGHPGRVRDARGGGTRDQLDVGVVRAHGLDERVGDQLALGGEAHEHAVVAVDGGTAARGPGEPVLGVGTDLHRADPHQELCDLAGTHRSFPDHWGSSTPTRWLTARASVKSRSERRFR